MDLRDIKTTVEDSMLSKPIKLCAVFSMFSSYLCADHEPNNLAKADKLFAERSVSINHIRQAANIYEKIIESTKDRVTLLHAIDRFSRLAVLEGEFANELFGINIEKPDKIFSNCIKIVKYASPKKLKEDVAEYYYWRASCTGLLASHASKPELVVSGGKHLSKIKKLIAIGQKKFPEYDGRGFFRLEAGLLSRVKALEFAGLYKPELAIKLVDYSVEKGCNDYYSYILKAESQVAINQKNEAIKTLNYAVNELTNKFSSNLIPSIVSVENTMVLAHMRTMISELM